MKDWSEKDYQYSLFEMAEDKRRWLFHGVKKNTKYNSNKCKIGVRKIANVLYLK